MATAGIQLLSTGMQTVLPSGYISFNTVLVNTDSNITFATPNTLTFASTGQYYVSWFVSIATSHSGTSVTLQAVDGNGVSYNYPSSSTINNGIVSGSAILTIPSTVTTPPALTMRLVNSNSNTISIGNNSISTCANITVVNLSSSSSGSGFMIPFATPSSSPHVGCSSTGASEQVAILAFGNNSSPLTLTGNTFSIPTGTDGCIMQFTNCAPLTVQSISATFSNWTSFSTSTGSNYYPYIQLATAPNTSNNFTMLAGTQTLSSAPYAGGQTINAGTILNTSVSNLGITISANTQIAIMGGLICTGSTPTSLQEYIYMNGTVLFNIA